MHLLKIIVGALAGIAAFAATAVGAVGTPPAAAWETVSFQAVVSGTSTLHDWSVETTHAGGEFQVSAGTATGRLVIAAKSLAGGPKGLNEKMYAALNAERHPNIVFEARNSAWPSVSVAAGVPYDWPVHGWLTIAGARREAPLACRVTKQVDGQLAIEASVNLLLTDFDIKPPAFMGVVRTGNAVTVQVRWVLRPTAAAVARS
jgi:polyisoprenoid-binding protein YceI